MRFILLSILTALSWMSPNLAEEGHSYSAGLEMRDIASLSESDIEMLEAGHGWGLALPAELNGYPGPKHVLELAGELDLTPSQRSQIADIYEDMRSEAVATGSVLIAAERALDQAFKEANITDAELRGLVDAAGFARSNLRYLHLSRHLLMMDILSAKQIEQYSVVRGYADDPCSSVPVGHDEKMWRLHNGC